jgi:hypothetical protein
VEALYQQIERCCKKYKTMSGTRNGEETDCTHCNSKNTHIQSCGCGQTTNFLGGTTEEKKNAVRSEEVYIPIEKVRTLNPIVTKDEDAYYVDKLIIEGMFGFDENLALTNVLADHYSYAPDGGSVTIYLKKGITGRMARN